MFYSRRHRVAILGILILAALGIYGGVRAQERDPDEQEDTVLSEEDEKRMSGPEKVAWVANQFEKGKAIQAKVQSMLEQAEKEKDTIKITCLKDKLANIQVNLLGMEERLPVLQEAVGKGDTSGADHQFSLLKIHINRIRDLRAEAETCLGEVDIVLGNTQTEMTIDDDVTDEDPSDDDFPDQVVVGEPPRASAFI